MELSLLKRSDVLKDKNETCATSCCTTTDTPLFATAVILAGGSSRRMGFDKQTLSLDGRPLIERTVELLRELFDDIVIVTDRPQLYRDEKVRVTSDVFPGNGPIAGIHAGLLQAKSRFVYVIGCDMPHPELDYINLMKRKLESADASSIAGCMMRRDTGCLEPLNAFYNTALTDAMDKSLEDGKRSLQSFCRNKPFVWIKEDEARAISPKLRMFHNINDFADLIDVRGGAVPSMSVRSEYVQTISMARVTEAGTVNGEDYFVREGCLSLIVNGVPMTELHALPDRWHDLVIGWLYTQGQILGASEVTSFHVEPIEGRVDAFDAHVELNGPILLVQKEPFYFPLPRKDRLDSEWHSLLSPLEVVGEIMNQLDERTSLFRETGGTHSMILFDLESRKVTDVCEDTSRHTCLDKLIGRALLEHRDLSREGLAMSCRVTTTIMRKIIRADIPFVLTRSATTAPAVQQACEAGITLICFARGRRYNLMT